MADFNDGKHPQPESSVVDHTGPDASRPVPATSNVTPMAELERRTTSLSLDVPVHVISSERTPTATTIPGFPSSSSIDTDVLSSSILSNIDASPSTPPSTLSPGLNFETCPQLGRSLSTASSVSSISGRSTTSSRLSDSGLSLKRRGYSRPQATIFSPSAKNRESVMSLGSIAHLQYYFARTGLLDGKGGQLARGSLKNRPGQVQRATSLGLPNTGSDQLSASPVDSGYAVSEIGFGESPIEQDEDGSWDMLPPTVSTYKQRPAYVPPPPDLTMLRRELTEALEDALKVLKESDKPVAEDTQGWYEIQGLHLLDITTLAIRAAKNYYLAHTQQQKLASIKSQREIRSELYAVLDILKRMAARNFAGGMRQHEKVGILTWIVGISELIQTEIDQEKKEAEMWEKWTWRTGDWTGREREREREFIKSFVDSPDSLPPWDAPAPDNTNLPTPFLTHFQSGLRLVMLHNALVRKSKRHFEEIKVYHTDTAKPYRCADNLRYWLKAAQLRWDVALSLDALAVVQSSSPEALRRFDDALLKWCRAVREEITAEGLPGANLARERKASVVAGSRGVGSGATPMVRIEEVGKGGVGVV